MPTDTRSITGFLILALEPGGGWGGVSNAHRLQIYHRLFLFAQKPGGGRVTGGTFAQGTRSVTGFLVFLMNFLFGMEGQLCSQTPSF